MEANRKFIFIASQFFCIICFQHDSRLDNSLKLPSIVQKNMIINEVQLIFFMNEGVDYVRSGPTSTPVVYSRTLKYSYVIMNLSLMIGKRF